MRADWRSTRARRALLILGLGLVLLGLVCMYVAVQPVERTVTYNGPMSDSIVIGKIPGRIGWQGGGHISAEFNATGGTEGNYLIWRLEQESSSDAIFGSGGPNTSISDYPLPRYQALDIVLSLEWGGSGNVSAQIHWRVSGTDPLLFVPGIVAFVAGILVAAMARKKKERLANLTEFEKQVKL